MYTVKILTNMSTTHFETHNSKCTNTLKNDSDNNFNMDIYEKIIFLFF